MASKGEAQSGTPQEEAVSPQLVLPEEAGVNTPDRISWDAQQGLQDVSSWGSQGEIRRVSLGRVCCSVCPRFGVLKKEQHFDMIETSIEEFVLYHMMLFMDGFLISQKTKQLRQDFFRYGRETFLVQLRRQTMQNQIGDCDSNDSTA